MAYQSLYRRYRPQRFGEVWGQEHLVAALRNAVREDRVGHAYLFSGPRGTGKTTSARILAKALNCPDVADGEPCGVCESCVTIAEGSSFDVFELDAASNNGVDAIRDLTERANQGSPGRRKVYILDEVHMLSSAASNALLKTLEEPPAHVVFVLATTDPQKVLPTIKSRTQHFEVHLLSAAELQAGIEGIIEDAGLDVSPEAMDHVLRAGGGSARDTISALERVVAFGGVPEQDDVVDQLIEALAERSPADALAAVERGVVAGRAPRTLGEELMARLRDVFLASVGAELTRLSDRDLVRVQTHAANLGPRGSTHALEVLGLAFQGIREAPDPRIPLEVALLRLTRSDLDTSPSALLERIERLERLERQLAAGGAVATGTGGAHAQAGDDAPAPRPAAAAPDPAPGPAPAAAASAGRATGGASAGRATGGASAGRTTGGAAEARKVLAEKRRGSGAAQGGTTRRPPKAPVAAERPAAQAARPPEQAPAGQEQTPTAREQSPTAREQAPAAPEQMLHAPVQVPDVAEPTAPAAAEAPGLAASEQMRHAPVQAPDAGEPTAPAAAVPTGPAAAAPAAAASSAPAAGASPAGATLSFTAVEESWPRVLDSLPQKAKVRFAGGRVVGVEGDEVEFGLPNDVHRKRCEELRQVVEESLVATLGRPVSLRLVVDSEALPPRSAGIRPAPAPADEPTADEDVDLSSLVDANDTATNDVERIAEVFPGAELIDEEPFP